MSAYPPKGCIARGCSGHAVYRGYCSKHQETTTERHYGWDWQRVQARVIAEERACRECGTRLDLTVDHRVPQSMGGTNVRSNLRVLCRSCHARIGRKVTSR